jgi:putative tryptophan/tyrosine transport system substrate-binding protein
MCAMKKASVSSAAVVVVLLAVAVTVDAQQPKKVPRIGYLSAVNPANESARAEGIRLALHERGYIEGQNIAIEYRYGEGKIDRYPELANELVRLKNDIIVVAGGIHLIRAAKNATKTIPIVMVGAGNDPVEAGLIESLARPGANVTGLTNLVGKLGGKRLELLKEAVPKVARVAVIYEPATPANVVEVKEDLPSAARTLKLAVQTWEVRDAAGFDTAFAALSKQRPDGLYVAGSPLINANQKRIAEEPVTVSVRRPRRYRGRCSHVLRGGSRGQLPARSHLRRQNPEGS